MKKIFLTLLLFIFIIKINAQSFDHTAWKLSTKTTFDSVTDSDLKNYPYHYLMHKENAQIYINEEKTAYHKYTAKHVKAHINSLEGMNYFKEVYSSGTELFQYRIIKANGEVIDNAGVKDKEEGESNEFDFDFSILRNFGNLDFLSFLSSSKNKIENLDSNCQLEYILITKQEYLGEKGDTYGMKYIQKKVPIYNYEYNLISPDNYFFKISPVNGCPIATEDESDDKNYLTVKIPKIEAIKYSPIVAYDANKLGFFFVAYRNTFSSKTASIYNYSTYARSVYENVMRNSNTKDKLIKKLIKEYPDLQGDGNEKHIKLIEKIINKNFDYAYGSKELDEVIKQKSASSLDRLKLVCSILNYQKIKYEIVNPIDRRDYVFVNDYDNPLYLNEAIIYVPKAKVYLNAANRFDFANLIPSSFREGYAMHTKAIGVGDFETGSKSFDSIPALDYTLNAEKHSVAIDLSNSAANVSVNTSLAGFHAFKAWSNLTDLSHYEKQDLYAGLAKLSCSDALVSSGNISKINKYCSPLDTPVLIDYSFVSKNMVATNGNVQELKIGGLINSSKAEMPKPEGNYAPDNYSGYLKMWEITIAVPKGYKLENKNELTSNMVYPSGSDKEALAFKINHKIEGDKVIVTIEEFMSRGKFTPADMDNFLKIYNAGWALKDLKVKFTKI